jgi:hypothetical protein
MSAEPGTTGAAGDHSVLEQVILRAHQDPGFRGKLIWFPDKVVREYALEGADAQAVRNGEMKNANLSDEVREIAGWVYDLHDLHAGE